MTKTHFSLESIISLVSASFHYKKQFIIFLPLQTEKEAEMTFYFKIPIIMVIILQDSD